MANAQIVDDADPFETTASGDLLTVSSEELARERILRLLFTAPGEIIHRPQLGGGLQRYRAKAPTPHNLRRLRNDTERMLDALNFVEDYEVVVQTTTSGGATCFSLKIRAVVDGVELTLPEVTVA